MKITLMSVSMAALLLSAPAMSANANSPCRGKTLDIQTLVSGHYYELDALREPLHKELGLVVPMIRDLAAEARQSGTTPMAPRGANVLSLPHRATEADAACADLVRNFIAQWFESRTGAPIDEIKIETRGEYHRVEGFASFGGRAYHETYKDFPNVIELWWSK